MGAGDPLPWLKLPELDYVDVAGQPKKSPKPKVKQKSVPQKIEEMNLSAIIPITTSNVMAILQESRKK